MEFGREKKSCRRHSYRTVEKAISITLLGKPDKNSTDLNPF
jgi:hypothetical protein